MSELDEASLLREVPPFQGLGAEPLRRLGAGSKRLAFEVGRTLIVQGELGDAVFVIVEGQVEVSIESGGTARVVRLLGRHAFLGEIAVLARVTRTATVTAVTPVTALRIEREVMHRLLYDEPGLADAIREHMTKSMYVYD